MIRAALEGSFQRSLSSQLLASINTCNNDWTDGQLEYELFHRNSSHIWTIIFLLPFTIVSSMRVLTATIAIASFATLTIGHGPEDPEDISLAFQTQNRNSPLYSYPTDLTREVVPVSCPSLVCSSHGMSPE